MTAAKCGIQSAVYPRVCGGTSEGRFGGAKPLGLSPRVRGNPVNRDFAAARQRSIPACAGEPLLGFFVAVLKTVYPRVCGGTRTRADTLLADGGLSPRVRGNRWHYRHHALPCRSIPACAGEPCGIGVCAGDGRVYPRVCGGTFDSTLRSSLELGLSPRVRGNPMTAQMREMENGSIPACAGEPQAAGRTPKRRRVYPRVCGGTPTSGTPSSSGPGLSPRVRGNLPQSATRTYSTRSIPACAGEPGTARYSRAFAGVYPRVCGGTS